MIFFKRESISRENNQPYLERWILFRCQWFGILFHKFLASDDTCEHDHPWAFVSLILKGGYFELTPKQKNISPVEVGEVKKWYDPWSLLFRPATWIHRIKLRTENGKDVPAYTLIIHGPRTKTWGFFTRYGWIHWSKYIFSNYCSEN